MWWSGGANRRWLDTVYRVYKKVGIIIDCSRFSFIYILLRKEQKTMKKYILIDVSERSINKPKLYDTLRAALEAMAKAAAEILDVDSQEIITDVDTLGFYTDYDLYEITEISGYVNSPSGNSDWSIFEIDIETWACREIKNITPEPFCGNEEKLFFKLDGEAARRYGAVGFLRIDFGKSGNEFHSTWFDIQKHLKTSAFQKEFDKLINCMRHNEQIFMSRQCLQAYIQYHSWQHISDRGVGFKIRTEDYTYYARCRPCADDYDVYFMVYDNRWLLPELGGTAQ